MNTLEEKTIEQAGRTIDDADCRNLLLESTKPLLSLALHAVSRRSKDEIFTRPFFAKLHIEAAKVEELLDAIGARNNRRWFPFRETVAAAKLFSRIGNVLLHLYHTAPVYRLLPIEEDFSQATADAAERIHGALLCFSEELLRLATDLGFPLSDYVGDEALQEIVPSGGLASDRAKRHIEEPGKTVCYLATAFLNLSEDSRVLEIYRTVQECDYAQCVPDSINEQTLRIVEDKFHNLQSLYDTYLSDSDIEDQDADLKVMRGHVSIIYHLLSIGTELVHYYERHMSGGMGDSGFEYRLPVSADDLLRLLMNYAVAFAHRFVKTAHTLCQTMLRIYAEQGRVEVTVPRYRGFHVRPSTLVAKIIAHYGSSVDMEFEGEHYDASRPLELFRANEQITAKKRKFIAERLGALAAIRNCSADGRRRLKSGLKDVWFALLEYKDVIAYDPSFSFHELAPFDGETLAEYAKRWIARCLALGKFDIDTEIVVAFSGDRRVLDDLRLLAEHGYGEDRLGNNVGLPEKLTYLRR